MQDFTTGSWTLFAEKTIIGINTSRFDASKRRSVAVVGDALMTLNEIAPRIDVKSNQWLAQAQRARVEIIEEINSRRELKSDLATYAQVVIAVN